MGCADNMKNEIKEEPSNIEAEEVAEEQLNTDKESEDEDVLEADQLEVDEENIAANPLQEYYLNITEKLFPSLKGLTFKNKSYMRFPSSLAEDLEGGGIVPEALELFQKNTLVGVIAYLDDNPYPITLSFSLPKDEDGFIPPIVHYELIDIDLRPVLRVVRSISGNLSEGPFEQTYYIMHGYGKGLVPFYSLKSERIPSDKVLEKIQKALYAQAVPKDAFSRNCPKEVSNNVPANIQLEFKSSGILQKIEYNGFTTDFFYYYPSASTISCLPIVKYMISPDDERIEEEVTKQFHNAEFTLEEKKAYQLLQFKSSSKILPEGSFCQ